MHTQQKNGFWWKFFCVSLILPFVSMKIAFCIVWIGQFNIKQWKEKKNVKRTRLRDEQSFFSTLLIELYWANHYLCNRKRPFFPAKKPYRLNDVWTISTHFQYSDFLMIYILIYNECSSLFLCIFLSFSYFWNIFTKLI